MRRLFSIAFVVLVGVVGALKIAEWASENWWMASLGFGDAQIQFWKWRLQAFAPAFGLWWFVLGGNARLAWHNAHWRDVSLPLLGPRALAGRGQISPEDRVRLDLLARRGVQGMLLLSSLLCGVAAANHFDLWVLALHPPAFAPDASGADTAFLVGRWPAFLWAWNAFGVLLICTLALVAAIAAFEGVLDFDTRGLRVGDATARHLSFCGALLLLWIGVRCGLSAQGEAINFGWSPGGISGFYEHTFGTPTRCFFLLSSPVLGLWFARMTPRRPLRPLVVALCWSFGALFLPLMAPSFGRSMRGQSASLDATLREEAARHLDATRRAWGLDGVPERALNVVAADFLPSAASSTSTSTGTTPTPEDAAPGMGAWPQEGLRRALAQNDTGEGLNRRVGELYFGREGQTLNARVISSQPSATGANSSLALESDAAHAGSVSARRRQIEAIVMQLPPAENLIPNASTEGEENAPVVPTRVRELENVGGVARDNAAMGLALTVRFGNRSFLRSGKPLTWHLDPLERVRTLAPFVWWEGARPHPVLTNGATSDKHLFWLVEGCFVSRSFPGSAMLPSGDEWSGLSYARQSVLGVCDASTGETRFFLFDPNEPFSRVWNELLPGFFRPTSELPDELRRATRLSPALLNSQTLVWARYHPAPASEDEPLSWSKRGDEWRALVLDTSARDALVQPVVVERAGQAGLELLAAFAPAGGTLTTSNDNVPDEPGGGASNTSGATPLVALLSARDEGETIWKNGGKPRFLAWRAAKSLPLPLSSTPVRASLSSPFAPELFDKLAILPFLDARGDCVGLCVSRGQAELFKAEKRPPVWTLQNRLASTKMQLSDSPTSIRADPNLATLRALWSAWKTARAQGRWARVEELERELNRLLGS